MGLRTATQADLEKILKFNTLDLKGFKVDSGLGLKKLKWYNDNEEALRLTKQIGDFQYNGEKVVIMNLHDLEVEKRLWDYDCRFNLREDAKLSYAPKLNKNSGYFSSQDIDEKTGLPSEIGNESAVRNRFFYTKKSGLLRLRLTPNNGLELVRNLIKSDDYSGRVVVVKSKDSDLLF